MKVLILVAQLLSAGIFHAREVNELAIIVATSDPVSSLSLNEVRDIFLKNDVTKRFIAREMNEGSPERNFFTEKVLRLTQSQLREHWGAKMNQGYEEWPRKNSPKSMVSFVARGGRIGYVDVGILPTLPKAEKVKVLLVVKDN